MKRLGGALVLGVGVTSAALVFASRPLAIAGIGLLLAAGAAKAWATLASGRVSVVFTPDPAPATEGDRVRLEVAVTRSSRIPVGSMALQGTLGRLGAFEWRLRGHGRVGRGSFDLGPLARGLFVLTDARVVLGDHLGLESLATFVRADGTAVAVHPRLVELEALFSDAGRYGADGKRLLLRRPSGFDFHSVREYEQGESLRRVHWPTTARRGNLMVKELHDPRSDAVVVLLDCDPASAAGVSPDSSFDAAVRAAGSVLRAYVTRGRAATLVTSGDGETAVQITSRDGDFQAALSMLAAAEPNAEAGLAQLLRTEQLAVARAGELVVVTGALDLPAAHALVDMAARRLVSVVWVDASSFAGQPTRAAPAVLRLSAVGMPVAVVRCGDDLASVLGPRRVEKAVRA